MNLEDLVVENGATVRVYQLALVMHSLERSNGTQLLSWDQLPSSAHNAYLVEAEAFLARLRESGLEVTDRGDPDAEA